MAGHINSVMETTLRVHIRNLEERLQTLTEQLMANRVSREERNRLEAEIRAANLALAHYRTAIELEKSLFRRGDAQITC